MPQGRKLRLEHSSAREAPATGAAIVRKGRRRRRESFGSVASQLRLSIVEVFERRRTWRRSIASSLYLTRLLQDLEVDPLRRRTRLALGQRIGHDDLKRVLAGRERPDLKPPAGCDGSSFDLRALASRSALSVVDRRAVAIP